MLLVQQLPSIFQYHKTTKELNLQTITLYSTPQKFFLVPTVSRSFIQTALQIQRKTGKINQYSNIESIKNHQQKPLFFSLLIGILNLNQKKILFLAQQVIIIGAIGQRDIFKITKPVFLFFNPTEKQNLNEDQAQKLIGITATFEQGMYFSLGYDLSVKLTSKNQQQSRNLYNWASFLQKQMLNKCSKQWRTSIIQGFVGRIQLHVNGLKINIILVSRRAIKRGGTQTFARGLDSQGNSGNLIQTQQILVIKDYYFSFLQLRGTVPTLWKTQATNYGSTNVKTKGNLQTNYQYFCKHLKNLCKNKYDNMIMINLLSSSSKNESKLTENYQFLFNILKDHKQINQQIKTNFKYIYFDIHKECPDKLYTNLNNFVELELQDAIQKCGFNCVKYNKNQKILQTLNQQTGIIRVNCFTCIDRSNIFQSRTAAMNLISTFKFLNIKIGQFQKGLSFLSKNSVFSNLYRHLWADNADQLSKQYTGTGSTESYAIRKGKLSYMTTLDHGMKSIFRAIRNIRNDDQKKQQIIDFLTDYKTQELNQK